MADSKDRAAKSRATAKRSLPARAEKRDPHRLQVESAPSETLAESLARTAIRPTVQAAYTMRAFSGPLFKGVGELDINKLVNELGSQCQKASGGDLGRHEALLTAQAHTLDSIFNCLARRAAGLHIEAADPLLRLALKAQSQCRTTIEALAEIKNPHPVAFVRQANIANGPQQINNELSRAQENTIAPNKVLEEPHARLESGKAQPAGLEHSPLETLAPINRTENTGREGASGTQRLAGRDEERFEGAGPSAARAGQTPSGNRSLRTSQ